MAQTQIELSDTQMTTLEKLAQERNISVAGLIQKGIDALIQSADYPAETGAVAGYPWASSHIEPGDCYEFTAG